MADSIGYGEKEISESFKSSRGASSQLSDLLGEGLYEFDSRDATRVGTSEEVAEFVREFEHGLEEDSAPNVEFWHNLQELPTEEGWRIIYEPMLDENMPGKRHYRPDSYAVSITEIAAGSLDD